MKYGVAYQHFGIGICEVKNVAEYGEFRNFTERATYLELPVWKCSGTVLKLFVKQRRKSSEGRDVSFIYSSRWSIPSDWPHGEPPIPTDETLIPAGDGLALHSHGLAVQLNL